MSPRLLIVDDNEVDRERIRRLLGSGYETFEAGTAGQALELSQASLMDCVLLDYRLPDHDGIEILESFVARGVPVVMLTGQGDERIAVEAMKRGAYDYLVKRDLDATVLRRAVSKAVELLVLRQTVALQEKQLAERLEELARQQKALESSDRELSDREAKLRAVLRQLPAIVWTTDIDLRYTSVSGSSRLVSLEDAELEGKEVGFIAESARDWQALTEAHQRALGGQAARFEIRRQRRWFEGHAEPLRDDKGDICGVIGAVLDVTEGRQLEERLHQSQKMEALGKLAGGVAHDFNNLLTVIMSFTGFVREAMPPDDPGREDLSEVLECCDRGARLVRQLLMFSRQRPVESRVVDMNEAISGLLPMLRRLLGEDVQVRFRPEPSLWPTRIDLGALEQIVVNLSANARDAMPDGGTLSIATANVSLDSELALSRRDELGAGDYVVLSVSDDGGGIPPEIRDRLFEPFFTTKDVGRGTGLGLSTCYGIARQAGGGISVYSEPGQGSTFKIYLGRSTQEVLASADGGKLQAPAGGTERLLVVEDDAQVRALVVRSLARAGYQVLEAASPQEAREVVAAGVRVDLIVTDVVMPSTSGPDLSRELRKAIPEARVLYMSGYSRDGVQLERLIEEGASILEKPFTPQTLARKVREVLGESD